MSHNTFTFKKTTAILALFAIIAVVSCFNDQAIEPEGVKWESLYDSLLAVAEKRAGTDVQLAEMYLEKAGSMINLESQQIDHARFHLIKGRILYYQDAYLKSVFHIDTAISLLRSTTERALLAKAYTFHGSSQALLGDYASATESLLETVRLYNITGHKIELAGALTSLGILHLQQNDHNKAASYIERAQAISSGEPVSLTHATVLVAVGRLLMAQGDLAKAEDKFRQAYQIRIQCADIRHIASSMNTLSEVLVLQTRYEEAIALLRETEPIYLHLDDKTALTYVFSNYTDIYISQNLLDSALAYAEKSLSIGHELDNLKIRAGAYQQMVEIYEKKNETAKALNYYKKFHQCNDLLNATENKWLISNIEYQQELLKKSNDNEILIHKNRIRYQQNLILTVTSVALIIAALAILLWFRTKNKQLQNKQLILKNEKSIAEAREQLHRQEKMLLKNNLELKNKELTAKAVEMLHHVELLQSLSEKLNKIKLSDPYGEVEKVINELNINTRTNAWNEFHTAFNNVHNDFYDRLLKACPELTSTEIKIAALLRLNLCTKEIAAISFKSESAVKTARHRLRQKLNISHDSNLINFLMKL